MTTIKFHVFTRTPPMRALLGTVPEKWAYRTFEAATEEQANEAIATLEAPVGGEVLVFPDDAATRLTARYVTERT